MTVLLSEGPSANPRADCYKCLFRVQLEGTHHSRCGHPRAGLNANHNLIVEGSPHGFANGWFYWPVDYDPVWLDSCDGYTTKATAFLGSEPVAIDVVSPGHTIPPWGRTPSLQANTLSPVAKNVLSVTAFGHRGWSTSRRAWG